MSVNSFHVSQNISKTCLLAAAFLGFAAFSAFAQEAESTGPGPGFLQSGTGLTCGEELLFTAGGVYENGYAWRSGGLLPPYYGAFAECYSGQTEVCAIVFDLSTLSGPGDDTLDIFVWDDDGGQPGSVLCAELGVHPGEIAFWPSISRHSFVIDPPCETGEEWWVGGYQTWVDEFYPEKWFYTADIDGPVGCALTNIAPGIGFPTGWNSVSVAWGPTNSMGIGAEINPLDPTPIVESSWGAIKAVLR